MILNVSIDLGRGKEYAAQVFVEENMITSDRELRRYLQTEFGYIANEVVKEVVDVLRPESTADIFNKSLADHVKRTQAY